MATAASTAWLIATQPTEKSNAYDAQTGSPEGAPHTSLGRAEHAFPCPKLQVRIAARNASALPKAGAKSAGRSD
ncbi:MAG TPA: hypothetical protein VFA99_11450 [Acidobacteriaceae bacterium]|nr:hypothetical protein [Acidobacteriaceae bacterium]